MVGGKRSRDDIDSKPLSIVEVVKTVTALQRATQITNVVNVVAIETVGSTDAEMRDYDARGASFDASNNEQKLNIQSGIGNILLSMNNNGQSLNSGSIIASNFVVNPVSQNSLGGASPTLLDAESADLSSAGGIPVNSMLLPALKHSTGGDGTASNELGNGIDTINHPSPSNILSNSNSLGSEVQVAAINNGSANDGRDDNGLDSPDGYEEVKFVFGSPLEDFDKMNLLWKEFPKLSDDKKLIEEDRLMDMDIVYLKLKRILQQPPFGEVWNKTRMTLNRISVECDVPLVDDEQDWWTNLCKLSKTEEADFPYALIKKETWMKESVSNVKKRLEDLRKEVTMDNEDYDSTGRNCEEMTSCCNVLSSYRNYTVPSSEDVNGEQWTLEYARNHVADDNRIVLKINLPKWIAKWLRNDDDVDALGGIEDESDDLTQPWNVCITLYVTEEDKTLGFEPNVALATENIESVPREKELLYPILKEKAKEILKTKFLCGRWDNHWDEKPITIFDRYSGFYKIYFGVLSHNPIHEFPIFEGQKVVAKDLKEKVMKYLASKVQTFSHVNFLIATPKFNSICLQTRDRAIEAKLKCEGGNGVFMYDSEDARNIVRKAKENVNVLLIVIIDECHWGANNSGGQYKLFDEIKNAPNAVIVLVSATPSNVLSRKSSIPTDNVIVFPDSRNSYYRSINSYIKTILEKPDYHRVRTDDSSSAMYKLFKKAYGKEKKKERPLDGLVTAWEYAVSLLFFSRFRVADEWYKKGKASLIKKDVAKEIDKSELKKRASAILAKLYNVADELDKSENMRCKDVLDKCLLEHIKDITHLYDADQAWMKFFKFKLKFNEYWTETDNVIEDLLDLDLHTKHGRMAVVRVYGSDETAFLQKLLRKIIKDEESMWSKASDQRCMIEIVEDTSKNTLDGSLQDWTKNVDLGEWKFEAMFGESQVKANTLKKRIQRRSTSDAKLDILYEDLENLPCLLIVTEKARLGDTFPPTLVWFDVRRREAGNYTTLIQEFGRLCRYVKTEQKVPMNEIQLKEIQFPCVVVENEEVIGHADSPEHFKKLIEGKINNNIYVEKYVHRLPTLLVGQKIYNVFKNAIELAGNNDDICNFIKMANVDKFGRYDKRLYPKNVEKVSGKPLHGINIWREYLMCIENHYDRDNNTSNNDRFQQNRFLLMSLCQQGKTGAFLEFIRLMQDEYDSSIQLENESEIVEIPNDPAPTAVVAREWILPYTSKYNDQFTACLDYSYPRKGQYHKTIRRNRILRLQNSSVKDFEDETLKEERIVCKTGKLRLSQVSSESDCINWDGRFGRISPIDVDVNDDGSVAALWERPTSLATVAKKAAGNLVEDQCSAVDGNHYTCQLLTNDDCKIWIPNHGRIGNEMALFNVVDGKVTPKEHTVPWVFVPSYSGTGQRHDRAKLNYTKTIPPKSKRPVVVVVRQTEFELYFNKYGKSLIIVGMPKKLKYPPTSEGVDVEDEAGGVGYSRYFVQILAQTWNLKHIWMLDDNCFTAARMPVKDNNGQAELGAREECTFDEAMKEIEFLLTDPEKDCIHPQLPNVKVSSLGWTSVNGDAPNRRKDVTGDPDKIGIIGILRGVETAIQNPSKMGFYSTYSIYSFVLLNVYATWQVKAYYPPKKVWEDIEMVHVIREKELLVLKSNRLWHTKIFMKGRKPKCNEQTDSLEVSYSTDILNQLQEYLTLCRINEKDFSQELKKLELWSELLNKHNACCCFLISYNVRFKCAKDLFEIFEKCVGKCDQVLFVFEHAPPVPPASDVPDDTMTALQRLERWCLNDILKSLDISFSYALNLRVTYNICDSDQKYSYLMFSIEPIDPIIGNIVSNSDSCVDANRTISLSAATTNLNATINSSSINMTTSIVGYENNNMVTTTNVTINHLPEANPSQKKKKAKVCPPLVKPSLPPPAVSVRSPQKTHSSPINALQSLDSPTSNVPTKNLEMRSPTSPHACSSLGHDRQYVNGPASLPQSLPTQSMPLSSRPISCKRRILKKLNSKKK